jgi:beta-1,4-mannosyl-glycoprotein beta-1,4-N-acetylglucosaminyltransferase
MGRLIDCTLFFNEFRLLSLRLNILRDAVDRFVIVEADRTFSGQRKPLRLRRWITENAPDFADRILVIEVTDFPANPNPWIAEAHQRNAVMRGLSDLKDDDILLFFDVDEIPRIDSVLARLPSDDIAAVEQDFYYYYLNLHRGKWARGTATYARNMTISPQEARTLFHRPVIEEGGWHFSYLMTAEDMAAKIRAFSHQEFNAPRFTDLDAIRARIAAREDLFGRKNQPELVVRPLDDSFPAFLLQNRADYADLILDPAELVG